MRKLILLGVLTTVLLGVNASSASATTWSGTCHLKGKIHFLDSPLTLRLEHHDYDIVGEGSCEGTLNGAPYSGPASNYMDGRMNAPLSCAAGISYDVPGAITFGDDPHAVNATKVGTVVSEFNIGTEAPFTWEGAYNGRGWGLINIVSDESTIEKCAGPGITEVDFELEAHTITPVYG